MGEYGLSFLDYDSETSRSEFHLGPVNAGTIVGISTQLGALKTAVDGISKCSITSERFLVDRNKFAVSKPSDKDAQRERKWLVVYHDTVNGKIFRTEIPGADSSLLYENQDKMDTTTLLSAGLAFKAVFEDVVQSPYGNDVVIDFVQLVGRNL